MLHVYLALQAASVYYPVVDRQFPGQDVIGKMQDFRHACAVFSET